MSTDYTGIALIVTAIMGPLVAVFTLLINNRTVKKVGETATETLRQTTQVNHAVNGKDPRASTMSEDIIKIRDKQEYDLPTAAKGEVTNGTAVLPMLTYLTTAIDELKEDLAAMKGQPTKEAT